jgi:capsular polysaccharide biosynthesis protein
MIRTLPAVRSAHPAYPCQHHVWRVQVTQPTALYRLVGCRILGQEGTVLSSDNRVFAVFTYVDAPGALHRHPVFRRRRFPPVVELPGTWATITYPSSHAWFHWVAESLPRLQLLKQFLSELDGLFIPDSPDPQVIESLLAMGVRRDQLQPLGMNSHFRPEALVVPQYCAGLNIPAWVPGYLQRSVGLKPRKAQPAWRRIFISRSDATKRRLLNEAELLPVLEAAGFEVVRLRDLPFLEQVRLFHEAAWVIAPHGAGLVNTLYSQPGVQVIEIVPSPQVGPHLFHSTTTAAGGTYWWLPAQPGPSAETTGASIHQDFHVDPVLLQEALRNTGAAMTCP